MNIIFPNPNSLDIKEESQNYNSYGRIQKHEIRERFKRMSNMWLGQNT